ACAQPSCAIGRRACYGASAAVLTRATRVASNVRGGRTAAARSAAVCSTRRAAPGGQLVDLLAGTSDEPDDHCTRQTDAKALHRHRFWNWSRNHSTTIAGRPRKSALARRSRSIAMPTALKFCLGYATVSVRRREKSARCATSGGPGRRDCLLPRRRSRGIHQIAEWIGAGREHQRVTFADDFLVGLHGFHELVQVSGFRGGLVRRCVDARRRGVRRSANLLDLFVRAGLDDAQIALFVAEDLGGFAFTLGAKARCDLLSLGNHALVDFLDHARVVVDALETHVQKLDAELAQLGGRRILDLALDLFAP